MAENEDAAEATAAPGESRACETTDENRSTSPTSGNRTLDVPVMERFAKGWPTHGAESGPAGYVGFGVACGMELDFDAHFAAYSAPAHPHRLDGSGLALLAGRREPITMRLFVVDVDAPNHATTPEWRAAERPKIDGLLSAHPGGYVYSTRGGYRIVWALPTGALAFRLLDASKRDQWTASYRAWLDLIERDHGIVGLDRACSDWTRLYRLPRVRRDDVNVVPELELGDPSRLGVWRAPFAPVPTPKSAPPRAAVEVPPPGSDKLAVAAAALASVWPATGRHYASLALCGALARMSWDEDAIADFVCDVVQRTGLPGERGKRLAQARSSIAGIDRDDPMMGWTSLIETLGGDATELAVNTARHALGVGVRPDWEQFRAAILPPRDELAERRAMGGMREKLRAAIESAIGGRSTKAEAIARKERLRALRKSLPIDDDGVLARTVQDVAGVAAGVGIADEDVIVDACSSLGNPDMIRELVRGLLVAAEETESNDGPGRADDDGFSVSFMTGQRLGNQHNARQAIDKLEIQLAHDELADHALVTRGEGNPESLDDATIKDLRLEVERRFHFLVPMELWVDVLEAVAREHRFHPVKDYLGGLVWDGTKRLDTWLADYASAQNTAYVRAVSRLVLVAAVRRVRHPGCKFDEMLVLEDPCQGSGKSTLVQSLCPNPEWFTDEVPLNVDTGRWMEAIQGKWLLEAGELAGMSKADRADLKARLSRQVDGHRLAYGRGKTIRPRQSVIIGTTNSDKYLTDAQNRRWWPVRTGEINLGPLVKARDQIWAEAVAAEAAGESIRLPKELWPVAAGEQEERRQIDPYEERLAPLLDGLTGKVPTEEIWQLLGTTLTDATPVTANRLGQAMHQLGWEHTRLRRGGKQRIYCFRRGAEGERDVWLRYKVLAGKRELIDDPESA